MEREYNDRRCAGVAQPKAWLTFLLLILVGLLLFREARFWLGSVYSTGAAPRAVTARGDLADDEKGTIDLFKTVSPSVVYITTLTVQQSLFSFRALEVPQGAGSGFIWDDQGYIVTNYHVIAEARGAKVTLADRSTWTAQYVGSEPDKDLAVLKIDAPKNLLPPIPVGTSADLLVGQKVFAIGNPFGFDQTLTTGVISSLGREIVSATQRPIQGVIQTDAAAARCSTAPAGSSASTPRSSVPPAPTPASGLPSLWTWSTGSSRRSSAARRSRSPAWASSPWRTIGSAGSDSKACCSPRSCRAAPPRKRACIRPFRMPARGSSSAI
jgi:hypothetical protein